MPDLFQKFFRSSSKTKPSTLLNAPPSATSHTSTSHTSGDSTFNLNLVTSPIVESRADIQNERKQRCIAHGITALDLLKEISEASGVPAPLQEICGVTSAILNAIEVDWLYLSLLLHADQCIQAMDTNKEAWKEVLDTIHKHRGMFEQHLHSANLDLMRPNLDPRLLVSIQIYAR